MERKSMGSFIAVLRKANGLTQKDLAERLNVSDKSVSRWEREDGAPDLSLIPVLAEIFGVTCDELLRGERQSAVQPFDQQSVAKTNLKTDRQRHRILTVSLSRYQNCSLIAVGLSVAGLLAAMVCNFGFNRAYIGFLAGAVFYLAAVICQAICINGAFLSVSDEEMAGVEVERFKHSVVSLGEKVIGLSAVLLAASVPLMAFPGDTYMGLTAESWLPAALCFGLGGVTLCGVVCYFLNSSLQRREVYTLSEQEAVAYQHNFELKRNCALILLAALFMTVIGHAIATGGWDASNVATGSFFDDFATFKAYMEQDIPAEYDGVGGTDSAPVQIVPGSEHYYDEQGNEVTKDEAMTRTITDQAGHVVCEYIERNQSVGSMRYGNMNGGVLPITTFTRQEIETANRAIGLRNVILGWVYLAEAGIALCIYFRKRANYKRCGR